MAVFFSCLLPLPNAFWVCQLLRQLFSCCFAIILLFQKALFEPKYILLVKPPLLSEWKTEEWKRRWFGVVILRLSYEKTLRAFRLGPSNQRPVLQCQAPPTTTNRTNCCACLSPPIISHTHHFKRLVSAQTHSLIHCAIVRMVRCKLQQSLFPYPDTSLFFFFFLNAFSITQCVCVATVVLLCLTWINILIIN